MCLCFSLPLDEEARLLLADVGSDGGSCAVSPGTVPPFHHMHNPLLGVAFPGGTTPDPVLAGGVLVMSQNLDTGNHQHHCRTVKLYTFSCLFSLTFYKLFIYLSAADLYS